MLRARSLIYAHRIPPRVSRSSIIHIDAVRGVVYDSDAVVISEWCGLRKNMGSTASRVFCALAVDGWVGVAGDDWGNQPLGIGGR